MKASICDLGKTETWVVPKAAICVVCNPDNCVVVILSIWSDVRAATVMVVIPCNWRVVNLANVNGSSVTIWVEVNPEICMDPRALYCVVFKATTCVVEKALISVELSPKIRPVDMAASSVVVNELI